MLWSHPPLNPSTCRPLIGSDTSWKKAHREASGEIPFPYPSEFFRAECRCLDESGRGWGGGVVPNGAALGTQASSRCAVHKREPSTQLAAHCHPRQQPTLPLKPKKLRLQVREGFCSGTKYQGTRHIPPPESQGPVNRSDWLNLFRIF